MKFSQMIILSLCILLRFNYDVEGVNTPASSTAPFMKQCVDEINNYRTEHKVDPLKWSEQLERKSELWAKYLAKSEILSRSIGQSLYLTSGNQLPACSSIVQTFYAELNNYNYDNPGLSKDTERFTQLVWKNTKEIGVAYSERKDGKYIVVFSYKPQGNYDTKVAFQENVLKPVVKAKATTLASVQHTTLSIAVVTVITLAGF